MFVFFHQMFTFSFFFFLYYFYIITIIVLVVYLLESRVNDTMDPVLARSCRTTAAMVNSSASLSNCIARL